jgi:hypothetical protein
MMSQSIQIIYTDLLAVDFRLVVDCRHGDDYIHYHWKIEIVEPNNEIFGVISDGEAYESKIAAEVAGRLYYLMNYT